MSVTVTLYLWWLWVYLGIGAVLWLPLERLAWRSIHNPDPFWKGLWDGLRRRPHAPIMFVLFWPMAVWEELR